MAAASVYSTADGRDFPVKWPSEADARLTWTWDPEHNPTPATPLDQAIWTLYRRNALNARLEAGFPAADPFGRSLWVHGFGYYLQAPPDPEADRARREAAAALNERFGGPLGTWEGWCLPRIRRCCSILGAAGGDTSAQALIDEFGYGYEQTFLWFFSGARDDLLRFVQEESRARDEVAAGAETFTVTAATAWDYAAGRDELLVAELLQGYPTATLEADQALWKLGRLAADDARVKKTLSGRGRNSGGVPSADRVLSIAGRAFENAFLAFLERYGWRTEGWDPSTPTWRDHPERVLALLRRAIDGTGESPAEAAHRAALRREAVAAEFEAGLAGRPERQQEFRRLYDAAAAYMTIKEGRAYWQLTMSGLLGAACRRIGARLAGEGRLREADDVFYLLPQEIDGTTHALDFAALVVERRRERERWLGVVPPAAFGGEAAAAIEAGPGSAGDEIRGTGASRGIVTARARVVHDVAAGARLQPGEVLVCATTTPTWTPLFALLAALVTDGGGMLSHAAIAAREYGIPAVVGTRCATTRIRDGMMVTVDGTTGIVRLAS